MPSAETRTENGQEFSVINPGDDSELVVYKKQIGVSKEGNEQTLYFFAAPDFDDGESSRVVLPEKYEIVGSRIVLKEDRAGEE